MYELCLEYGTFPISLVSEEAGSSPSVPDFLAQDTELVAQLTDINDLFHSLFLEIEGNLDFIGREDPQKLEHLQTAYKEVSNLVKEKYNDVHIEPFYLA